MNDWRSNQSGKARHVMRTRVLRQPIVFLRLRCSILILLIKSVRCSIVRCSIIRCSIIRCSIPPLYSASVNVHFIYTFNFVPPPPTHTHTHTHSSVQISHAKSANATTGNSPMSLPIYLHTCAENKWPIRDTENTEMTTSGTSGKHVSWKQNITNPQGQSSVTYCCVSICNYKHNLRH